MSRHAPTSTPVGAVQRSGLGQTLYAIDAKKYGPDRMVGPEPVRAIYGVTDLADASVGMIVTTSRFSPLRVVATILGHIDTRAARVPPMTSF